MTAATIDPLVTPPSSARRAMIDGQLRTNEVNDPTLVAAIAAIAREDFVPADRAAAAYADRAIAMGGGRAINPPLATARLIAEAGIHAGDRVLLIGGATGYAASIVAALGAQVTMVDDSSELLTIARAALAGDAPSVTIVEGPLNAGAPAGAPYTHLLIDGAVAAIPASLLSQLADGARISAGLAEKGVARLARATFRAQDGATVELTPFADLECVTLPGFSAPASFAF
jgi:protein-L-isoaspartate(D-aspartate) O-methyltransferase